MIFGESSISKSLFRELDELDDVEADEARLVMFLLNKPSFLEDAKFIGINV